MTAAGSHRTARETREPVSDLVAAGLAPVVQLVRDEMRLAQAEMTEKGKRYGKGGGLLGGAAWSGSSTSRPWWPQGSPRCRSSWPVWAAALIVTGVWPRSPR